MAQLLNGMGDYSFLRFDPETKFGRVFQKCWDIINETEPTGGFPTRDELRWLGRALLLAKRPSRVSLLLGRLRAYDPVLSPPFRGSHNQRPTEYRWFKELQTIWDTFRGNFGIVSRRNFPLGFGVLSEPAILEYRNLGQFLVWYPPSAELTVTPFLGCVQLNSGHYHPHINDAGRPCWGNMSGQVANIQYSKKGLVFGLNIGLDLVGYYEKGHYANLSSWPVGPIRGRPYPGVGIIVPCPNPACTNQRTFSTDIKLCLKCGVGGCGSCMSTDYNGAVGHTACGSRCVCGSHWILLTTKPPDSRKCLVCGRPVCAWAVNSSSCCPLSDPNHQVCSNHAVLCTYCSGYFSPCSHMLRDPFRWACPTCAMYCTKGHVRRKRHACQVCGEAAGATPEQPVVARTTMVVADDVEDDPPEPDEDPVDDEEWDETEETEETEETDEEETDDNPF